MEKTTLNVQGMSCNHCVMSVKNALSELAGVDQVDVDLANGKVDVTFDAGKVNLEQMKEAIEDQGYDVI